MRKKEMKAQQECEEKKLATFTIPHILYCTTHTASWQTVVFTSLKNPLDRLRRVKLGSREPLDCGM